MTSSNINKDKCRHDYALMYVTWSKVGISQMTTLSLLAVRTSRLEEKALATGLMTGTGPTY